MDFKKEYQRYLLSPQWKELRAKARERSGNKCEFCGGTPDHVHHVKYPKRYKEDHLDNLVVACEACHEKLHGIRDDLYIGDWIATAIGFTFDGAVPRVKMYFSAIPNEHQNIRTFSDYTRQMGDQRASEIRDQLDGYFPFENDNFRADIELKNSLFEDRNTSVEEMLMSILDNREYLDLDEKNLEDIGKSLLENFNLGPVPVVFKK